MRKKHVMAAVTLLAVTALMAVGGFSMAPESAVRPIEADSPCPVVGCASGSCHGFAAVPGPDGVHEMACPEAGCSSVECHAWDSLTGRYHQASDASLNAWILAPTALVLGLWLLARKPSRGGRRAEA